MKKIIALTALLIVSPLLGAHGHGGGGGFSGGGMGQHFQPQGRQNQAGGMNRPRQTAMRRPNMQQNQQGRQRFEQNHREMRDKMHRREERRDDFRRDRANNGARPPQSAMNRPNTRQIQAGRQQILQNHPEMKDRMEHRQERRDNFRQDHAGQNPERPFNRQQATNIGPGMTGKQNQSAHGPVAAANSQPNYSNTQNVGHGIVVDRKGHILGKGLTANQVQQPGVSQNPQSSAPDR